MHLQVYDGESFTVTLIIGVCHDLPLFSMTRSARGAFRAIATFARYVTPSATSGGSRSSKSRQSVAAPGAGGERTSFWMNPLASVTPSMSRRASWSRRASHGSTPVAAAPAGSSSTTVSTPNAASQASSPRLGAVGGDDLARRLSHLDVQREETAGRVASPQPMSPASPSKVLPGTGETEVPPPVAPPVPEGVAASRAQATDDVGPRWTHDEEWDQPAKIGEAGHPSVYAGDVSTT